MHIYFDHGFVVNLFLDEMTFQILNVNDSTVRLDQVRLGVVKTELVGANLENQDVAKRVTQYYFVRVFVLVVFVDRVETCHGRHGQDCYQALLAQKDDQLSKNPLERSDREAQVPSCL